MKRLIALGIAVIYVLSNIGCKKDDKSSAIIKKNPVADFTFTIKDSGKLPTVVEFTSTSTNATAYEWDFGDSNKSTIQNPQNAYTTSKTYTVKLKAKNDNGSHEISKEITITDKKPSAEFSFTIKNPGIIPSVISFLPVVTDATKYE